MDFYVYNNNFSLFEKLLQDCKKDYDYYVIIPHFLDGEENADNVINTLRKEKLILLDKKIPGVTGNHSAIYENFEKDIYNALVKALPELRKYDTINIISPHNTYYPLEIITGLKNFCQQFAFSSKVIPCIKKDEIKKGEVYINVMEDNLATLVEKILSEDLKIGQDVLSYFL